jgi:hypothetical protein
MNSSPRKWLIVLPGVCGVLLAILIGFHFYQENRTHKTMERQARIQRGIEELKVFFQTNTKMPLEPSGDFLFHWFRHWGALISIDNCKRLIGEKDSRGLTAAMPSDEGIIQLIASSQNEIATSDAILQKEEPTALCRPRMNDIRNRILTLKALIDVEQMNAGLTSAEAAKEKADCLVKGMGTAYDIEKVLGLTESFLKDGLGLPELIGHVDYLGYNADLPMLRQITLIPNLNNTFLLTTRCDMRGTGTVIQESGSNTEATFETHLPSAVSALLKTSWSGIARLDPSWANHYEIGEDYLAGFHSQETLMKDLEAKVREVQEAWRMINPFFHGLVFQNITEAQLGEMFHAIQDVKGRPRPSKSDWPKNAKEAVLKDYWGKDLDLVLVDNGDGRLHVLMADGQKLTYWHKVSKDDLWILGGGVIMEREPEQLIVNSISVKFPPRIRTQGPLVSPNFSVPAANTSGVDPTPREESKLSSQRQTRALVLVSRDGVRNTHILVPEPWRQANNDGGGSGASTNWTDPFDSQRKIKVCTGVSAGMWYESDGVERSINPSGFMPPGTKLIKLSGMRFAYQIRHDNPQYVTDGVWQALLGPDGSALGFRQAEITLSPLEHHYATRVLNSFTK